MALQLYIGNKNYSSWSMRPWVLLKQAGIPFDEVMVRFDSFESDSTFKKRLRAISPVGKVPVLVDDGFAVWDTLAIAEYLAERFPEHHLWPTDVRARARARSVCAEMHSGFSALRNHCPMNIEASLPDIGRLVWRDQAAVRADVARLCGLSTDEVIQRHAAGDYRSAFCGFAPGFSYLIGGDPILHVPRLAEPRPAVPAGSVAIGGPFTAVYPGASPGGWRLLGRTDARMWDLDRAAPALAPPGTAVRFAPVRAGR